jgi:hypothetical protein
MRRIIGDVLFRCNSDPDVEVLLIGRAMVVAYKDWDPTPAEMPEGTYELVQQTLAIGFVNHAPNQGLCVNMWTGQYTYDSQLQLLRRGIDAWWTGLPLPHRVKISKDFDDNARIDW